MSVEDKLREKSILNLGKDGFTSTVAPKNPMLEHYIIKLSDALAIVADTYTREQVIELLRQQRMLCVKNYLRTKDNAGELHIVKRIKTAPSPLLGG